MRSLATCNHRHTKELNKGSIRSYTRGNHIVLGLRETCVFVLINNQKTTAQQLQACFMAEMDLLFFAFRSTFSPKEDTISHKS